jgi:hypothetical protein
MKQSKDAHFGADSTRQSAKFEDLAQSKLHEQSVTLLADPSSSAIFKQGQAEKPGDGLKPVGLAQSGTEKSVDSLVNLDSDRAAQKTAERTDASSLKAFVDKDAHAAVQMASNDRALGDAAMNSVPELAKQVRQERYGLQ